MTPREIDDLSFAEYNAACEGFESFHASLVEKEKGGAPSADDYYAALGLTRH